MTRQPAALRDLRPAAAAAALALVFLAQAYAGSLGRSLTWDEPGYIAAGYANWRWNDYRLNADHPPLMQKLQGLPLLFMDIEAPPLAPYLDSPNPRPHYGRDLVFRSGNDLERITRWGRAPALLLGFVLVLCIHAWGRSLFGGPAGLLAAGLAAVCPNLVGHAGLATEDLGCAALMFAAVFCFWRAVDRPGAARSAVCGVVTGLALLAKYTSLLLGPIYAVLAWVVWRRCRDRMPAAALAGHLAMVAGLSLLIVGLAYGARYRPDLYAAGVLRIYPDTAEDYLFYFWGRVSEHPFWYHALASLVLKVPLPTLALLGLAGAVALRAGRRRERDAFLLVPPLVVLAASCFDATNPGLRRVLPALPFLLVFAGRALEGSPGRARRAAVAFLLGWLVVEAGAIFPHHLSYLNALAGGPARGPYVFDESNVDWGQDLPALAAWQRAHDAEDLKLLYFGTAPPSAYGVAAAPFDLAEAADPPPGTYAISAHYLAFLRKLKVRTGEGVDWLERYQPVARAGYSIWIYQLGGPAD